MTTIYGYARVSTHDQDLSLQTQRLREAGCSIVRAEKVTGTIREGRKELETLLAFLRRGDTLMVTKIDRLARSMADLQDIMRDLDAKGIHLKALDQPVDTSSACGKAFMAMLGVFAEFENDLRRERQLQGIARAKAERVYKGRKPSIDQKQIRALKEQGLGPSQIAKSLKIGRASVYRLLNDG